MNYKSRRWRLKRQAILTRDRYQCRECRRFGLAVNATVVHHAYPAEDYPEFAWCDWNLVSLCGGCHNAMHDRETGALTELGRAWRRRVSPLPKARPEGPPETGCEQSFRRRECPGEGVHPPACATSSRAWAMRTCGAGANDAPAGEQGCSVQVGHRGEGISWAGRP